MCRVPFSTGCFVSAPRCAVLRISTAIFVSLTTKKEIAGFAPLMIQAPEQGEALAKTQLEECIAAYVSLVEDTFAKMSLPTQTPVQVLLWCVILTGNAAFSVSAK